MHVIIGITKFVHQPHLMLACSGIAHFVLLKILCKAIHRYCQEYKMCVKSPAMLKYLMTTMRAVHTILMAVYKLNS